MAGNISPNTVTDGLILNFDAANQRSYTSGSTTWFNLVSPSNNSTLTNGPTFNSSNGGSIVFDGIDDYTLSNSYIDAGSNFSVFAWIKPGNIDVRDGIVGNSYPSAFRQGFYFATATNYSTFTNTFFISIGQDIAYRVAANNSITLNNWNYVGGTVTNGGQDIKLYVNGIETSYSVGSLTSGTITYSTNQLLIGGRITNNLEPFAGSISNVQMYNRVLSATEILQNYTTTKTRFGL